MKSTSFCLLILLMSIFSLQAQQDSLPPETELEKLSRKLDNPLNKVWSLVIQNNYNLNQGTRAEGTVSTNTFFFQPSLPIPVGKSVFIARPVFPIVTAPDWAASTPEEVQKVTGFGDMQLFAMYGPSKVNGVVWGLGGTFRFPTASNPNLGQGKWQAGPSALIFSFSRTWTKGFLFQHWWSVGGDPDRPAVSQTEFQYVIRRNFRGAWSLGMGPNITVDWMADPENRWTVPIGLGITKTVKWGKLPFKMRLEPQYSIIRPKDWGTVWNIRLQFAPVLKNPLLKPGEE